MPQATRHTLHSSALMAFRMSGVVVHDPHDADAGRCFLDAAAADDHVS